MVSYSKHAKDKPEVRPHADIVKELYDEIMARGVEPPEAEYIATSTPEELENIIENVKAAKPGKQLVYGDFRPEKVGTDSDERVIQVLSENINNKKFGAAYKDNLMRALKN